MTETPVKTVRCAAGESAYEAARTAFGPYALIGDWHQRADSLPGYTLIGYVQVRAHDPAIAIWRRRTDCNVMLVSQ